MTEQNSRLKKNVLKNIDFREIKSIRLRRQSDNSECSIPVNNGVLDLRKMEDFLSLDKYSMEKDNSNYLMRGQAFLASIYYENNKKESYYETTANNQLDIFEFLSKEFLYENEKVLSLNNKISNSIQITNFLSDGIMGEDLLNIEPEVKAIANLISMKNLNTPLSIGIFGNWGSGKSFFMNKVKLEVERVGKNVKGITNKDMVSKSLSQNELKYQAVFCEDIIHIDFNAWHYVDANLWASLVSHIFEKISDKLTVRNESSNLKSEYRIPLLKQLEISKEQAKELELEKDSLVKKSNIKENDLNIANQKLEEVKKKSVSVSEVVKEILKDRDIIHKINEEFSDYEELTKTLERAKETQDGFIDILAESKGLFSKIRSVVKIINGKSILTILLVMILMTLLIFYLPFYKINTNEIMNIIGNFLARIVSLVIPIALWFNSKTVVNARNKVNCWCDFLIKLKNKQKEKINIIGTGIALELNNLKIEIKRISSESTKLEDEIERTNVEIKEIDDGKYIKYFIEERFNSNDYKQHLGVINLIRKDFEKLSCYLKSSKDSEKSYKIDRIILYIDDLDRCTPRKVVEVLQAIHLILSFELFVVLVAVDIRWISNCLCEGYKNMFRDNDNSRRSASSYDYLEKIFQIPIKMPPIHLEKSRGYIKELLRNDLNQGLDGKTGITSTVKDFIFDIQLNVNENEEYLEFVSDIELMQISENDIIEIDEFISILGTTPRTIKRFVNVYRLIKAKKLEAASNREVLFLLSIVIGLPNISNILLKAIFESESNLQEMVSSLEAQFNEKDIKEIEFKKIYSVIKGISENPLAINKLKNLIPIISRYSFHIDDLI